MLLLNTVEAMGALSQGMIYAILALGVFLSFRTLNIPDLTVDGSVVTGAAISAVFCSVYGSPFLGLLFAFIFGCFAGAVTGLLNTKLKIQPLLAGILVMFALYSINLHIMGGKPNIALTMSDTIYKRAAAVFPEEYSAIIVGLLFLIAIIIAFFFFLKTRMGFALRATGDNEDMVRAYAIDSERMKVLGLSLSNGLVGLAGGLLSQYLSFADTTMGTGMVVIGLASVILGEAVFGTKSLLRRLIAVALGAVLYRFVIAYAFHFNMPVSDLKLVSAAIVIGALAIGTFSENVPFKLIIGKKEV